MLTRMQIATASNKVEVVMALLDCGTDIDAIVDTKLQRSALEVASRAKQLDVVRLLFQFGASVGHTCTSKWSASALCWCDSDDVTDHSSMDVFKLFIENELLEAQSQDLLKTEALWLTSTHGCERRVHQLISLGADPYHGMSLGVAPIHVAVYWGNHDAYSALLQYHADISLASEHQSSLYLLLLALAGKEAFTTILKKPGDWDCHSHPEWDRILLD